jgi:hydrogenase expression/formation protein HypC
MTRDAISADSSLDPSACAGDHCITCSDEGVAMTVLRVDAVTGLALCSDELGATNTVETALIEHLAVGSSVLVHAGVAIAALGTTR